ncbi:MAG TPA: aminotransferase class V-fold PLP-dependent enzyme [Urbifossiella sp.]
MAEDSSELPAILGGRPVRPEGPPAWPRFDPDVQSALASAISSGAWGQYHGEHVCGLEAELAGFHGVPHVLTCASGTLAIEAALRALRVEPDDEVILAGYDYEANFLTVHALGARPVLVDVAPKNWNLAPEHLPAAFTPRTRAVICSHLHGGLAPMGEVMAVAARHGVAVVEDAAQAAGATVQGKPAGTWGDIGTLSFGGSKLLSAGRGGALLFRGSQLFQRAKLWLQRGLQQWAPLSELQAAALRPQLKKLSAATRLRAEHVAALRAAITREVPGLVPFENCTPDSAPAYYKLGFRYDAEIFGLPREVFVAALRAEGIAFDAGFNAFHVGRSPSRYRAAGSLVNVTDAHRGCVVLHHPVLSASLEDVLQVAVAVAKVHGNRHQINHEPRG